MSVRDITLGDTIDIKFSTRAFATGVPTTLAGTPAISAYPGNDLGQITAGITLTADFDGVAGLNNVRVVATSGNGYATNTDYALVITAGTVGGVSVVGEVVGEFTTSRSASAVDLANGTDGLGAIKTETAAILDDTGTAGVVVASGSKTGYTLTATTGLGNQTANITGNLSGSVGSVTGAVGSVTGAVGSVTGSVGSVTGAVGSVTAGVTVSTNSDKTGYSLVATTGLGNQTANITGNLSGSVGSVTGAVGSVTGAVGSVTGTVTVGTNNDKTGYSLTQTFPANFADLAIAITTGRVTVGTNADKTGYSLAATTGLGNQTADITGNLSGSVGSVTGAVGSVTGNVGGNVTGTIGSLAAQAKADVNAEVVDALATDTYAEPGQGAPAATAALSTKLNYLYKAWRNKSTQTATQYSLYNDDAATVDHKAAFSDDATTATRGEIATGP